MRNSLLILGILLSSVLVFGQTLNTNGDTERPNIVLIIADDLGYGELGCQGNMQIPTPAIDALAENGVRFTAGYVTAPNCSPSRAGILSGRYQTRFGYENNPIGHRNELPECGLPSGLKTLANVLHDCGYATGLVGKWHLGASAEHHPERHGFDEFFGFLHEGHSYAYPKWNNVTSMYRRKVLPDGAKGRWKDGNVIYYTAMGHDEPPYDANNPVVRSSQPVEENTYLTDAFTREALSFIQRHKNQPFFLKVAYNAVHSPLQALNEDLERFSHIEDIQRRIFAAMLSRLDNGVGKIAQQLVELGLEENTLIIFLSDNGGPTKELTSSNLPLRGGKGTMYEGGIRIPFMMQWPDKIEAGTIYDKPVISLDIFPTAAKAANAEVPPTIDGVDLLPYLTGKIEAPPHDILFWRQKGKTALRKGDWKIVNHGFDRPGQEWELYNMLEDIAEKKSQKESYPEKFQELYTHWSKLNGEMADPIF